jgi:glycine hydroxymethyltransferase
MSYLKKYFAAVPEQQRTPAAIAYMASLDAIGASSPEISQAIVKELMDQRSHLKLIASENFSSLPVQLAMGNLLTDKYSEGYPGHRFYAGCENVDAIESEAAARAKKIFGADHAYVQPHSGADANLVAFWAILVQKVQTKELEALGKKSIDELTPEEYEKIRQLLVSQKILGMSLGSGGHLTHGYRHNISSKIMQAASYDVDPQTGLIDYTALQKQAQKEKPLILVAGYSAYPRLIDFAKMREIADSVGAVLLVDMAHFAGLVAGKVMQGNFNPVPFAHIVTTTTHKTLRGPRGGLILAAKEHEKLLNSAVFPQLQGGPLMHVIAAKAVAFKEAMSKEFRIYQEEVIANTRVMAKVLAERGMRIVSGRTDCHLCLVDLRAKGITGKLAEDVLERAHITVNKNAIPNDPQKPTVTSGIRVGAAAVTTRGFEEFEAEQVANLIGDVLDAPQDEANVARVRELARALCRRYPVYADAAQGGVPVEKAA